MHTIKETSEADHARTTNRSDAMKPGVGSPGTAYINFNDDQVVNAEKGVMAVPSEVKLGHELQHLRDYDGGMLRERSINPETGVYRSEERAISIENQIRHEMKLTKRVP